MFWDVFKFLLLHWSDFGGKKCIDSCCHKNDKTVSKSGQDVDWLILKSAVSGVIVKPAPQPQCKTMCLI